MTEQKKTPPVLRMGRIGYLNVLPIYHPLEAGILPHDYELVSGPPALLNTMMACGELHVSSCSCFEYASRPERYQLVEDLSIGSHGPVMSVLLLSRVPFDQRLRGMVHEAATSLGLPCLDMVSGASHDMIYIAQVAPGAMIFVPSMGGRSHAEVENTSWEDCAAGADVLLHCLIRTGNEPG